MTDATEALANAVVGKKPLPDPATLHEILDYDASSGLFIWKERPRRFFSSDRGWRKWNTRYAGTEALATVSTHGYRFGSIFKTAVAAHRVAFAMSHGRWATGEIDHINGQRDDNRICNLRECTRRENAVNTAAKKGASRFKGVSFHKAKGRWRATFGQKHIGYRESESGAARLYDEYLRSNVGGTLCLNFPLSGERGAVQWTD